LTEQILIVTTQTSLHEWNSETKQWNENKTPELRFIRVFAGQEHAWSSRYRHELMPYAAAEQDAELFRAAWFNGHGQAGYEVHFVVEHAGLVWFGGSPWERFRSTRFYRIDPKTGEFRMYNLRDGFRSSVTYEAYDGVAIGDSMWVATSAGLARVTPRIGGLKE
jgi:streptogramin lyase